MAAGTIKLDAAMDKQPFRPGLETLAFDRGLGLASRLLENQKTASGSCLGPRACLIARMVVAVESSASVAAIVTE
jgi:hypothetical protein